MPRLPAADPPNTLYYEDNLDVLRRHVADESIDLVYLDPPFNSNADYNAFFAEKDGSESSAQIKAFEDTWEWGEESARAFNDFITSQEVPDRAKDAMLAFEKLVGHSDMLAYLAMMAPRLVQLHRVLEPTGRLYLHCDPTASHYLKLLLDGIFGPQHFVNEIIWKRTAAHSDAKQGATHYGRVHDIVLFYTKTYDHTFNVQWLPYDKEYIETHYRYVEEGTGRRYRKGDLTANKPGGDTSYEWKGVRPYKGRYWAYSKQKMEGFESEGRLVYTSTGMPEYKRYLDEMPGRPAQSLLHDIPPINSQAAERLGYPTQKPLALLERILLASSNEGDVVLDPFCGCGTTVAAAQKLNRRWIGIDITYLAVNLIRNRLLGNYGPDVAKTYQVIGEPTDVGGAAELARTDPYQFQWWALSRVGARAVEKKKGADKGIDGRLYFHDEKDGAAKQVIFSVKAGENLGVGMVRDLVGVLDREKAAIGVLVTMHDPTKPMRQEAASAGFYTSGYGHTFPRVQVLTVRDLLHGKGVEMPAWGENRTYKAAAKVRGGKARRTPSLPIPEGDEG